MRTLRSWVDSATPTVAKGDPDAVDGLRLIPFFAVHLLCLAVFAVGISTVAVVVAVLAYAVRMFAITAFYHRYFAHRAFRTSRWLQFCFAFLGNAAGQRGPLWWAAHHRKHHRHSDTARDVHSPHHGGAMRSHLLWFATARNYASDHAQIRDFARFPELRFLDRFDVLAPAVFAAAMWGLGAALERWAPGLGTDGPQMFVWGFAISTVVLFHGTSTINSLGHLFGRRRYATPDTSRNNWILALITFGEGWHNNHHFYPVSARQGFFWWEIDLTWYCLWMFSRLGLVWDLLPVPAHVRRGERVPPRERRSA
jgi:stearoyl-CoA desaturase (delta-9 desaturase)